MKRSSPSSSWPGSSTCGAAEIDGEPATCSGPYRSDCACGRVTCGAATESGAGGDYGSRGVRRAATATGAGVATGSGGA